MKSLFPHLKITFLLLCFSFIDVLIWYYRYSHYDSLAYKGLLWNLVLAWIPYLISLIAETLHQKISIKYVFLPAFFLLFCLWLLFFPNAPYIITDLIHLGRRKFPTIPLWYDAIMIFSFALTGLLLAFLSLQFMQEIIEKQFNKLVAWILTIFALGGCAFGIYLGRVERWNSWDIISEKKSGKLFTSIFEKMFYPFKFWESTSMTLLFFVLLLVAYITFRSITRQKV